MKLAIITSLLLGRASASVVLSEEFMSLVKESAKLSVAAYNLNLTGDDYIEIASFTDEPDLALFARLSVGGHDYCFGAFRGTTTTWMDWQQNLDPTNDDVCVDLWGKEQCCTARNGYFDAYSTSYVVEFEDKLRECAKTCTNIDECVILTGHSQGGAVAAIAGLILVDLNPYVITFGQPDAIFAPCPVATSERWFRFVNTMTSEATGIMYDVIPFSPSLGAASFGHLIILSDDTTGIAYMGLDSQDSFGPLSSKVHSSTAYLDRIEALMGNGKYPVRSNGFIAGSFCSQDKECESNMCGPLTQFGPNHCIAIDCRSDADCESKRCELGACITKTLGSCEPCNDSSDCTSGSCILFKCSNADGLMDDNCSCRWDSDCESERCEGLAAPLCEAKLGLGGKCDEDSDCLSNYCTWSFVCGVLETTSSNNGSDVSNDGSKKWWWQF